MTRLNGAEVWRATIDDLVFDLPALIAYCSTFTRLEAGNIILSGTTGGPGAYRRPPLRTKPGDIGKVKISGTGTLRNPMAQEE